MKAKSILFVWAGGQTYSLHTLKQTGGPFTPPYLINLHSSRVNIIYGVQPCFFQLSFNERAQSPLPASLTLCVTLWILDRRMELFSIFCLFSKFGTSEHSSEGLEGSFNCCRLLQLDRTLFTCLIHIHTLTELHTYVSTCCENSFAVKYFLILGNLRNKLNIKTFINTLSALAATCWLRARVEQICVD